MGDIQYEKTMEAAINAGCPNFVQYYDYTFIKEDGKKTTIPIYKTLSLEELSEYVKKYGTCKMIIPASMY